MKDNINTLINEIQMNISEMKDRIEQNKKAKQIAFQEGDLRENAAYITACENEARYARDLNLLEQQLENLEEFIMNKPKYSGYVSLGSKVKVKYLSTNKEYTFIVTPEDIANYYTLLPINSPLGVAIQGKRKGDKVAINVLGILHEIEIIEVQDYEITKS